MSKLKKLLMFTVISVLSISLFSACSSNTNTSSKDKDDNPKPVVDITEKNVEITWWAFPTFKTVDGVVGKYEESLVAKFNEKYPNIKVKVEMIDFQNGPEKIATAIEGKTAPDVLFDAPGRIIDYGTSGKLVSLNDLYEETKLKSDITSEAILEACSDGSNYWMYPTSAAPFVMAVSKTALEKEGLLDKINTTGDRTWTTEEFVEISKEMAKKGYKGVEIYAGGQGGDQGTRAFITNLTGASIMNKEKNKYVMDSEEGKAAYQLVKQGVDEGWLTPNTQGVANDALDHFTTPVNATFWAVNLWSPNLAAARASQLEESNIEVIAMSLPAKDGKPSLEYLVNGYCIFDNKDADKIEASKLFVKFLSDDEVVGKETVLAAKCFPVRKSFGDLYAGDEEMNYYASVAKYYGQYYNSVPGFATMRPFWWGSLQAMLIGDKTPEEAAKYFVDNANPTLEE